MCRLCGDEDKMINHLSECRKLVQKEYTTQHDGGKDDPLRIVKEIEIDHMNKWYMHKPESVIMYEMNKIFWDFEIQRDHLIPIRRPRDC